MVEEKGWGGWGGALEDYFDLIENIVFSSSYSQFQLYTKFFNPLP